MKLILLLLTVCLLTNCGNAPQKPISDSKTKSTPVSQPDTLDKNIKTKQIISKDSTVPEGRPTYQDLYSREWKRDEIQAKLKFGPSTKKDTFNFKLGNNVGDVQIELYHINDRIIRVEKRIFDKNNDKLKLEVFDFANDNSCTSMTQWKKEDRMSYIYSMYGDSLIKYDANCNLMELNSSQRQKIIQLAKASLDSTMQHFPKFKYSFNWK